MHTDKMNIIAFGDIHMATEMVHKIPALSTADLVLITGDITNFGHSREAAGVLHLIAGINPNILAVPGNLDHPDVNDLLVTEGYSLHGRGRILGEYGILGCGASNPTPFNTPFELGEKDIEQLLESGRKDIQAAVSFILTSHAPPLKTGTDCLASGAHVGSSAVRNFIEKHQPAVCVTGHIHEARGEDYIGSTHILNPGMLQDGGWIEITVSNKEISAKLNFIEP